MKVTNRCLSVCLVDDDVADIRPVERPAVQTQRRGRGSGGEQGKKGKEVIIYLWGFFTCPVPGTPELCRTDSFSVQHTFLAFLRDSEKGISKRGKRIITGGNIKNTPRHLLIFYETYKNNKLYVHKYCI